jgi:uncharacterized membrane protein YccC
MSAGVEQDFAKKTPAARAWKWLRAKVRDHNAQLRLCLRVTVAALVAFILAQVFTAPLAGLWAVLTAVLVTQMSLGASVTATIEYFVGTLGGAIYAGAIAVLIPHHGEISLLIVIALAVAPLAFLAAVNPHFRVGPFTAVIVVLAATATHIGPLESAVYRVMEVALGGVTGLVVSLMVLPARAEELAIEAAADMLGLLARALAELAAGFTHDADAMRVRELQDRIGAAFARVKAVAAEASGERYLATPPDPGGLLHTLLRQRHDLVMIGRAAAAPLPGALQMRLGPPLARVVEVAANYLRACSAALLARRAAPSLDAVGAALQEYAAAIAAARRERLTLDLSVDELERIFALGFAFEQLHADFIDLAGSVNQLAQSKSAKAA